MDLDLREKGIPGITVVNTSVVGSTPTVLREQQRAKRTVTSSSGNGNSGNLS